MGSKLSTLPKEDVLELSSLTKFTPEQIQQLYQRFTRLDRDGSGTLSAEEFLAIPEFTMNPLSNRVLVVFQYEQLLNSHYQGIKFDPRQHTPAEVEKEEAVIMKQFTHSLLKNELVNVEVDFRTFVKTLAIFSPKASKEAKSKFAFRVYNLNGDGYIKPNELYEVLKLMVGENLQGHELEEIVKKTFHDVDMDRDGKISYSEFSKILLEKSDFTSKMIISICS